MLYRFFIFSSGERQLPNLADSVLKRVQPTRTARTEKKLTDKILNTPTQPEVEKGLFKNCSPPRHVKSTLTEILKALLIPKVWKVKRNVKITSL